MFVFAGVIVVIAMLTLVRGVTIDQFWSWFLTDSGAPFHGSLPDITTAEALGLSLIVSVFVFSTVGNDADHAANSHKTASEVLAASFIRGMIIYGIWWIFAIIIKGWI